ncbi:sensor histidine kinase [Streptomyces sp. PTM05]|uniref:histidine kinase n=1 Tax=Streptantibioticus parmotrematis TaxID=2873249 RepID=A0ABS7QKA7_9ACTN|nr:histidine kinase [Streptantibioticus parmotrematis]MBY8883612.1 sensor histidine kinase [Streptantibioticus parmotrematis]
MTSPHQPSGPGARPPHRGPGLRGTLAGHPLLADALLTVLLLLATTAPARWYFGHHPVLLAFQAAIMVPLAWRRKGPWVVFGVVAAVAFGQWLYGMIIPGDVALLVALYTVAAHCDRTRTWIAAGVLESGIVLASMRFAPPGHAGVKAFVALSGMAVAAGVIGMNLRTRRAYLAALEDRAARLERERDQRAQLAVAGERARIAREMHDIVTHSLSVMVALADGAKFAVPRSPDKAVTAMDQVSDTGRQALTDMRRFLGKLRPDEPDAVRHPQPGIAQLDALAAQVRAAGLPVRLTVEGGTRNASAAAQLTVYRLVQEALTNTLKHASPGARATVRVSCRDDRIGIEVRDDGRPVTVGGEGGHGIAGMRDRVAAYGAVVEAGPLPHGGWRVATCLSLGEPVGRSGGARAEERFDGEQRGTG